MFRHLVGMHPGRLSWEVFRACPSGRRPWGTPRTYWRDYISWLALERLGVPSLELVEVVRRGEEHLNLPAQVIDP